MHFEDYITGNETHGSSMWQSIIKGPHKCSKEKQDITTQAKLDDFIASNTNITKDEKERLQNNFKGKGYLCFSLPSDMCRHVRS